LTKYHLPRRFDMKKRFFEYLVLVTTFAFLFTVLPLISEAQQKDKSIKGKTVNINKATEQELVESVPLITPELAKNIVKYRKENGNFQTLEELLQVDGFDRTLLRRIKPFLLLEGIGGKDCTC
jgi:competence ComEA-like helix-hairpin-helix protein